MIPSDHDISVKDIQAYFNYFLSKNNLTKQSDYLINVEDNEIIVLVNDEDAKTAFNKVYAKLQLYFIQVGITNKIKTTTPTLKKGWG